MLNVMLVEDNDVYRKEIKRFKLWGANSGFIITFEAKNGYEALKKLEKESVDLVLTDIKMPIIDGIELLYKIMSEKLCSCVVLMSEYNEFDYAKQGITYRAFDYLLKPINEADLEKLLKRAEEYINTLKAEKEKIIKLEEMLTEKIEGIYPYYDINQILKNIKECDLKAIDLIENMIFSMADTFNNDITKISYVLKNVIVQIISFVRENYSWMDKFLNLDKYVSSQYLDRSDLNALKEKVIQLVTTIIDYISMFKLGNNTNEAIQQICLYIISNIENNVTLQDISESSFLNKSYISDVFKQKTGVTLVKYMTMAKMEMAKKILINEKLKNYEIAEILGYKDVEYFSKVFKKYAGVTPVEFREMKKL